jgi:hypothetical protein
MLHIKKLQVLKITFIPFPSPYINTGYLIYFEKQSNENFNLTEIKFLQKLISDQFNGNNVISIFSGIIILNIYSAHIVYKVCNILHSTLSDVHNAKNKTK